MRRRRLRRYLKTLADLTHRKRPLKRDELHQALGAAKKEAGRDARHVRIQVTLHGQGTHLHLIHVVMPPGHANDQIPQPRASHVEGQRWEIALKRKKKVPKYSKGDLVGIKSKHGGQRYWFMGGSDIVLESVSPVQQGKDYRLPANRDKSQVGK